MNKRNGAVLTMSMLFGFLTAMSFAGVPSASAQMPGDSKAESVSKVERKGRAPVSKEILQVKLPKPVEIKLNNGATLLVLEDHRFPTVTVDFTISGAGGLWDPKDLPGLANITGQMMREGTTSHTSKQIDEEIDSLGASLSINAPFGDNAATLSASGLSDNFEKWFPIVADVLVNANFPASELAKLQQRLKVQLVQQRQQPRFLATERFSLAVYGDYPAAVISPTTKSIDAMTPELLAKWHKERFAPQNTIIGFVGDVHAKELAEKLNAWFANWPKSDFQAPAIPATSPVKDRHVYVVDRPNSVQTTLAMGNIAIDRTSPDYPAMVVMDRVLGAGASGRLFLNLRENKGYTYGVYSSFSARKYAGPVRIGGDARTEVTEGAMTEFWNEFNRIRDEKVPAGELDDARHAVVAGFALSLERPERLLNFAIEQRYYKLAADYWDKYPAQISAISADDVQRVAQKYIVPDTMQVVAVGNAGKIVPIMQKYGTVQLFDTQGNPVEAKPAEK